jgi:transposase
MIFDAFYPHILPIIVIIMANPLSHVLNPPEKPLGPIPHPPIRKPKAPDLTRDQRRDCQLLHLIGWSYSQIHKQTSFTIHQIAKACQVERATPKKRSGRPSTLTQAQVEELVEFVCASAINRRMSFAQLAKVLDFGVKRDAIRTALLCKGFHLRLAMRKPPIIKTNRKVRLV